MQRSFACFRPARRTKDCTQDDILEMPRIIGEPNQTDATPLSTIAILRGLTLLQVLEKA